MHTQSTENPNIILKGLVDYFIFTAQFSPFKTAGFEQHQDTYLYASGIHFAPCNGVLQKSLMYRPTKEEIDHVLEFFKKKCLPFVWWTGDRNLEKHGFLYGGEMTGIDLDISGNFPMPNLPEGFAINKLQKGDLQTAANIIGDTFNLTATLTQEFKRSFESIDKENENVFYGVFEKSKLVSVISLSMGETAGFWSFSTLPEYEKRGLGTALVYKCIHEAKEQGYNNLMAILMPKGKAWNLSKKIGFKAVCKLPFHVYGYSPDDIEA